jgi:hypothetical protein
MPFNKLCGVNCGCTAVDQCQFGPKSLPPSHERRLQIYLDNLCRQLDIARMPISVAIFVPFDNRELQTQLKVMYHYIIAGPEKDGFTGTILQYNDRKFFFVDTIITY